MLYFFLEFIYMGISFIGIILGIFDRIIFNFFVSCMMGFIYFVVRFFYFKYYKLNKRIIK